MYPVLAWVHLARGLLSVKMYNFRYNAPAHPMISNKPKMTIVPYNQNCFFHPACIMWAAVKRAKKTVKVTVADSVGKPSSVS